MRAARELLKELEYEVLSGSVDINVNDLVYNTAKVTKECLFVCIKGMAFDSHASASFSPGPGIMRAPWPAPCIRWRCRRESPLFW